MTAQPGNRGRILALDLGTKTIGMAVSDPGRTISQSLGVIRRKDLAHDLERLGAIIREQEVAEVIVGLPLHLSGKESQGSERARQFAARLSQEFGLPVRLVDESFSTAEAEAVLLEADLSRKKRKKVIDGLAAAVILETYLNQLHEKSS